MARYISRGEGVYQRIERVGGRKRGSGRGSSDWGTQIVFTRDGPRYKAVKGVGSSTKAEATARASEYNRSNPARKPPKGWIPASAVKIERRNGAVKVRIKRR